MRASLVQWEPATDSAANRESVDARLSSIDPAVDLVVLPEASMHDFGDTTHDLAAAAEPLDGPFVEVIAHHARRLEAVVVAGMFEATDHLPLNTLVAVGPDGDLLAAYRKIHLYDSFGYRESDRLGSGEISPVTITIGSSRWGLMTCYDLRFPELARLLVDEGADGFILPAAWVAGDHKLHHWRTLLTARAVENTAFMLAAAQGGSRYTGHSLAIDPMGVVLAEAGEGDETLTVDLDLDSVEKVRAVNPSLANRRIGR